MSSFEDQVPQYDPVAEARRNTAETLAGFFAAASLFVSLVALAYHPVPLSVASALLALVASGMSSRFVAGMVIAIVTGHSLW